MYKAHCLSYLPFSSVRPTLVWPISPSLKGHHVTIFQSFPFGDCMKFALGTFNPWGMEPLAFHAMKISFHEAVTLAIAMEQ